MVELREATVYWDAAQKSVILKEGVIERVGGAYGYFNDTLLLTGWGVLEICAGCGGLTAQEDETTFFLAGYLEGYLTAVCVILQHLHANWLINCYITLLMTILTEELLFVTVRLCSQ